MPPKLFPLIFVLLVGAKLALPRERKGRRKEKTRETERNSFQDEREGEEKKIAVFSLWQRNTGAAGEGGFFSLSLGMPHVPPPWSPFASLLGTCGTNLSPALFMGFVAMAAEEEEAGGNRRRRRRVPFFSSLSSFFCAGCG